MWSVDHTGEFRFSDKDDPTQLPLLEQAYDQKWLADALSVRLAGKTMTVGEVKEYVLTQTPCYLYKEALGMLEKARPKLLQVLDPPRGRKTGTFADDEMKLRFAPPGLF
jgi:hypothetical protein